MESNKTAQINHYFVNGYTLQDDKASFSCDSDLDCENNSEKNKNPNPKVEVEMI